jgi:U3 small nucleolar RNA-associated protein 6
LFRALQKFPSSAPLWILAAQYEYDNNFNITGARNLLLRSLRLNPEKRELWLEYAKLECLYISKIVERRRILGLDKAPDEIMEDETEFEDRDEITLPTITQEELQADGPRLDPLLTSPLTDMSTNPALNGAIPMAIYSSAIASRPDDIALVAGFYETFSLFYAGLSFVDSTLENVVQHLEEKFPGRAKTLFIEIKDHARGIEATEKEFPAALGLMIKTASAVTKLPMKERKECCVALSEYLESLLQTRGLDENLRKAIGIFKARVGRWQDSAN